VLGFVWSLPSTNAKIAWPGGVKKLPSLWQGRESEAKLFGGWNLSCLVWVVLPVWYHLVSKANGVCSQRGICRFDPGGHAVV
jgi:hypothetical protein